MSALDHLSTWPVATAAAGVTDAHSTLSTFGEAGDIARSQPWASVTKLITAYGVLRLLEVGDIDLDEPAGPPGSTVRHLLAHASGLNLEGTASIAEPGRRRIYSNGGYQLLGDLIAKRTGSSVDTYLTDAVIRPLGMTASTLTANQAATGGSGPLPDLLTFARELLAPTLVDVETFGEATSVAFPGLDGVLPGFGRQANNDWGLGFEIRDGKQPHWTGHRNSPATFGHFGQEGSFLWVDPKAGIACAALTGTAFGAWAAAAWPPFSDAVLEEFSRPGR